MLFPNTPSMPWLVDLVGGYRGRCPHCLLRRRHAWLQAAMKTRKVAVARPPHASERWLSAPHCSAAALAIHPPSPRPYGVVLQCGGPDQPDGRGVERPAEGVERTASVRPVGVGAVVEPVPPGTLVRIAWQRQGLLQTKVFDNTRNRSQVIWQGGR